MVYWDADARKDLLIGRGDGKVQIFSNTRTDDNPGFDSGTYLQVGLPGLKSDIDVGSRATLAVADWDNDGRKDLVVGALDGLIRVFINEGTDTEPDFVAEIRAQANAGDLVVPSNRSSPVVLDLDGDGKKDLLTGNTNGQLLLYSNTGSDAAPTFAGYWEVEEACVPIDLAASRSRPSVCDWTGDGRLDLLIGASDGNVRLYEGVPMADFDHDADVDIDDFNNFGTCMAGPDVTTPPIGCDPADFDHADRNGDGDVDLGDLAAFQTAFTGTGG